MMSMSAPWRHTVLAACTVTLIGVGESAAQSPTTNHHRPVWMPDGEHIIVMSDRDDGDWELYTMRFDGADPRRLTHHPGWDGYASVSPTGNAIVFDRADEHEGRRLVWMDLHTGRTRVLVRSGGEHMGGGHWAPDGQRVYFQWEVDESREIYAVAATGGEPTRITHSPEDEYDFAVAPDGRALVAVVRRASGNTLVVLDLETGQRRTLMTSPGAVYGPDWSPDGRYIAYNDDRDGDQEIFIIPAAGGTPRALTSNDVTDHLPVWSPDSARLIFTTERSTGETVEIREVR